MKLKAIKSIDAKDYELSKNLELIKEFLDQFSANEFIKGEMISLTATSAGVTVNHGLGVTPSGFFMADIGSNATVWRTAWTDKTITLVSSSNVSIRVWVF